MSTLSVSGRLLLAPTSPYHDPVLCHDFIWEGNDDPLCCCRQCWQLLNHYRRIMTWLSCGYMTLDWTTYHIVDDQTVSNRVSTQWVPSLWKMGFWGVDAVYSDPIFVLWPWGEHSVDIVGVVYTCMINASDVCIVHTVHLQAFAVIECWLALIWFTLIQWFTMYMARRGMNTVAKWQLTPFACGLPFISRNTIVH